MNQSPDKNVLDEQIKPNQALITEPYVAVKILELKNAYQQGQNLNYDLYLAVGLDLNIQHKTKSIQNTPDPEFYETHTFNLQQFRDATFVYLGVYDKDDFGSDEFVANQILPTKYFLGVFNKRQKTKVKYNCIMDQNFNYEIEFLEDEESTSQKIDTLLGDKKYMRNIQYKSLEQQQQSEFCSPQKEASIISSDSQNQNQNQNSQKKLSQQQDEEEQKSNSTNDEDIVKNNEEKSLKEKQNMPNLLIEIELFDMKQLYKLKCDVIAINKTKEDGVFSEKNVIFYELFVKRADGLAWRLQRRYKQIRKFRDDCIQHLSQVKQIDFPSKDVFLQFKQLIALSNSEEQKVQSEKRKQELQTFFDQILEIDLVYSLEAFETFFTYN